MPSGEGSLVAARRTVPLLYTLATLTLVTAILFWAKAVLIPLALAMLLAFLLDPVVAVGQLRGLPRVLGVLLVGGGDGCPGGPGLGRGRAGDGLHRQRPATRTT